MAQALDSVGVWLEGNITKTELGRPQTAALRHQAGAFGSTFPLRKCADRRRRRPRHRPCSRLRRCPRNGSRVEPCSREPARCSRSRRRPPLRDSPPARRASARTRLRLCRSRDPTGIPRRIAPCLSSPASCGARSWMATARFSARSLGRCERRTGASSGAWRGLPFSWRRWAHPRELRSSLCRIRGKPPRRPWPLYRMPPRASASSRTPSTPRASRGASRQRTCPRTISPRLLRPSAMHRLPRRRRAESHCAPQFPAREQRRMLAPAGPLAATPRGWVAAPRDNAADILPRLVQAHAVRRPRRANSPNPAKRSRSRCDRGSREGPRGCHTLGLREQPSPSHTSAAAHAS